MALAALRRKEADIMPSQFLEIMEASISSLPARSFYSAQPWIRPLPFDALTALGLTLQQLATSPYHNQFKLSHYLPVEIFPPLRTKQLRCFVDNEGMPLGIVSWAWLTTQTKKEVHRSGRALTADEWTEGNHLFFNDWIADKRGFRAAVTYMAVEKFPDEIASSLRRKSDGSVRRINKWVGRNKLKETA